MTRTIEKAPAPSMGTVIGSVKNKADGKPIAEAVVSFTGQPRARVATDPDGSFQSVPLPPGPADITVAAAGFEPATGKANVVAGSASTVEVALVAKVVNGNVRGKVSDRAGRPMAATIRFNGPNTFEAHADASGRVLGDAAGRALPRQRRGDRATRGGTFRWTSRRARPAAGRDAAARERGRHPDAAGDRAARADQVPVGGAQAGAPRSRPSSRPWPTSWPTTPRSRPCASRRTGAGPAKGKGGDAAKKLTQKQATAIKDYLVAKGAPADRIETVGVGGESPLVPNLGPANQAKNRRVELVVQQ